jgi:alpha-L-rhamnosidase
MYPAMKHFLDYLATTTLDGLRAHPQYDGFRGYGDWLSIDEETPLEVIGTAYYAHAAGIMARAADILGHCEDADRFKILDQQIRDTFITRFLDEAVDPDDLSQTCIVLALQFDLAPEAMRDELIQALVRNIRRRDTHLSCGFLGSPHLPHVLVDHGQADVAYDLLLQTKWPSWLYAVVQGATTIWERWDGWTREKGFQDPGMNSFNHYAYGAVGEWLITQVAGIQSDPDDPGYRNFILRPHPDPRLTFAQGEFLSPYGKIHSAWRFEPNGGFYWDIDIPENSQAEVHIPIRPGWRLGVADGKGEVIHTVDELPNKDTMIYRHHAGGYRFEVVPPRGFV